MIEIKKTERGFKIGEFKDRYNQKCSIQESSLAFEDCIWLGVNLDLNSKKSARMHLTKNMAKDLVIHLNTFIETGFL